MSYLNWLWCDVMIYHKFINWLCLSKFVGKQKNVRSLHIAQLNYMTIVRCLFFKKVSKSILVLDTKFNYITPIRPTSGLYLLSSSHDKIEWNSSSRLYSSNCAWFLFVQRLQGTKSAAGATCIEAQLGSRLPVDSCIVALSPPP